MEENAKSKKAKNKTVVVTKNRIPTAIMDVVAGIVVSVKKLTKTP
jgi:hypothetical protein